MIYLFHSYSERGSIEKMKKIIWLVGLLALMFVFAGCGNTDKSGAENTKKDTEVSAPEKEKSDEKSKAKEAKNANGERTIEYLGEQYTVPEKVERIVITGAIEALEDAVVLDVHPVGAVTFGGEFPEIYKSITDKAESIGEKTQPNFETILKLKPDVILGTAKFPEEVVQKLEKIAPTILVSHHAVNWEANLHLLAELSGKQKEAEKEIEQYQKAVETAKSQIAEVQDKNVLAVRIRGGKVFIYPEAVFFNPVLYDDLGLKLPDEVAAAKAQENISVEQLARMNPDYLFIQFADDENADNENALDELLNNPIVKNMNAVKNDTVFVNVIDPLAQGSSAWGRMHFLEAALKELVK